VTVEERLRATTEAVTETMRPVRPLNLRSAAAGAEAAAKDGRARPPRRWPGWLIPLAAAAAVIALAATLVSVRALTGARPAAPSAPAPAPTAATVLANSIPRYFVELNAVGTSPKGAVERNAFLDDESTGRQVATFKPPSNAAFTSVAASPDGRTFVLQAAAGPGFGPDGNPELALQGRTDIWYVLRVTPGATAKQARLTRVPVLTPTADSAFGYAVSPGGRTLAVLSSGSTSTSKAARSGSLLQLRTYSLATGRALRTWTAPLNGPPATENNVTWLDDGRTVAFDYPAATGHDSIRTVDTTGPGTDLVAASRLAFSEPNGGACFSALLTSDGKSVICGTLTSAPQPPGAGVSSNVPTCDKGGVELTAYSVATGKAEGIVYRYTAGGCSWGVAQVVWARSAAAVIGAIVITKSAAPHPQISSLGVAAQGKFTVMHGAWTGPGWIAY
jgi:hypothetical protein